MTHSRHLLRSGSALALVALVSACSSGNNTMRSETTSVMQPTPEETARTSLTDLDGYVAVLKPLAAGADTNGSALKMAVDYSKMITVSGADGNSRKARKSAQKVLDARTTLETALANARDARKAAMDAKADLPADADPLIVRGLDDSIAKADTQIKVAQAVLDAEASESGSLASYVQKITGTDTDNPKTAADTGMAVANAIAAALTFKSETDGRGLRVALAQTEDATVKDKNKLILNDAKGDTWAEIVGETNIQKERIGAGNTVRMVASVAGMTAEDVDADVTATGGTDDTNRYADAYTSDASSYKGIPGDIFCLGNDCRVENGKLVGSWYFSPTLETAYYIKGDDDGMYDQETMYAEYGHWLTDENGEVTVTLLERFGGVPDGNVPPGGIGDWTSAASGTLAASASYSGDAVGRSVHKTLDTDGKVADIQSGRFEADVNLQATFGSTQKLSGTVTNFTSPDNPGAVDPDWKVTLKGVGTLDEASVSSGGIVTGAPTRNNSGVAKGSGQAGAWSAASYGEADKRPEGIFGRFEAHFTDGDAAGAYATRKDE